MPRASTSAQTLDSPAASASSAAGFRAPSKRSASRRASLNISRSRVKGKGKERARDEDDGSEWDEGDEGEGEYAPKARQVKVRKRRRSEGVEEEARTKRRKEERAEEPPEVEEKSRKERTKRKKGKEKAVEASDKPKKKSKKRVRIATPAPASSDVAGTDYTPSDADASDEADLIPHPIEGEQLEDDDWTDPLGIPSAQTIRGRKYWRLLDQGIYRSALHDAAGEGMDLGRALVQWEGLRRRREEEEEEKEEEWRALQRQREEDERVEAKKRKDDAVDEEESQAGTPAPGAKKKRPSAKAPHDPYRSLHPFPLSRDPKADEDADDPRHRLEYDSDGAEILPLPSSVALGKMARWPVHSSVLGNALGPDSLEDALAAEYERVYRRNRPDPIPRLRQRGPRSAYGPDGPFAPSSPFAQPDFDTSSSDADSDPLNSDTDSPLPPPSLLALPSLLSRILTRLADCVPKSAFPAYEYWSTRERDEEGRKEDARRGVEREQRGVGWEEVVEVAREVGVDKSIVNQLSAQLVALFGPSRNPRASLNQLLPLSTR
ncbi:hypothetical protein AAT19DRAFT_14193 [Rhodotorula toruloides]|uniref:Uncharacterized protein n=1 Tax=Rhodotorula toruloides TaxID=5286 RepID=A0A2T0AAY7_RHOTO|nr:hypothetical protein AAT19DRAFT_14193 [Rhodotorula toruloides]